MTIITVTPMLMTTSKRGPRNRGDRARHERGSEAAALYRLMTWLSPSFPVGAFSYSSGIEWAVESGDIADAASLRDWLAAMLADGSGFCDGVFLAQAHRAASSRDDDALRDDRRTCRRLRALARAPSRDLGARPRLSSTSRARRGIASGSIKSSRLRRRHRLSGRGRSRQRRACDSARAHHARIPSRAGVELDIGRRAADSAGANRQPARAGLVGAAGRCNRQTGAEASLDDLGSATFRADLASMRHETQYTRLFRS